MDCFIGEIRLFPFVQLPNGWMPCEGQILKIQQNQALFSLLGVQFGGDGVQTFALPDLRGRVLIHHNDDYRLGKAGGKQAVSVTLDQIPSHTHTLSGTKADATVGTPSGNVFAVTKTTGKIYSKKANQLNTQAVGKIGQSAPHDNMMPYVVMQYCIAITGGFPSRE